MFLFTLQCDSQKKSSNNEIYNRNAENNSNQFSYNYDKAKNVCFAKFVLRDDETMFKYGSKGAPFNNEKKRQGNNYNCALLTWVEDGRLSDLLKRRLEIKWYIKGVRI